MSWEQEYREKQGEVEESTVDYVASLEAKIAVYQKNEKRKQRSYRVRTWLLVILALTIIIWEFIHYQH